MLKEFKEFAMRGNVMDLAIGIIIGGAFGKIVSSFVTDVTMPLIGLLLGKVNFTNLFVNLSSEKYATLAAAQEAGAPTLNYGIFINAIVDFLIVAFVIFLVVKGINKMQKPAPAAAPTTKKCPFCFTEITIEAKRCPNCTSQLD
ncbi:MAG: large conductance mechanosensitive channel protein MscL [Chloroflexi bacterium HGW-Chloroflexi-3]|nr:MAG: large conductance mechanosensitive channel protein MscL [Chloroflexi bacterium HGW-Chloroflexi-3]